MPHGARMEKNDSHQANRGVAITSSLNIGPGAWAGAEIGTMVAPGVGTAVGAGVGVAICSVVAILSIALTAKSASS